MCSQCLLKTVGSAFAFDVLSLSDSLSEIFGDGIGNIFSFFIHSIQPQRFPAVFLQSKMLCCRGEGIQVGRSSPLGFLSVGNSRPRDLGKDVTD